MNEKMENYNETLQKKLNKLLNKKIIEKNGSSDAKTCFECPKAFTEVDYLLKHIFSKHESLVIDYKNEIIQKMTLKNLENLGGLRLITRSVQQQ